ncbi:SDR family oxidoreductase [Mucilaginibacter sp. SP1R1]|uniref:SDR family oxidoreductase n=1 Tax=Mucilaginibacter sp. SP1R1 TaxID=2723091 RepID=UPI001609EE71|nr:SDR family oxidoreductase [Mucilaginibacter sp. SP1R1]MBB6152072.1 NAD(P)-dependent dehydrogenase (short-subunit alcohol dehydrogenase family) [Mucilaginibacter sp. SP1R1]
MNTQNNNSKLQDKRVIIMGGTSGIGLATAQAAAAEGANVIVVSSNQQRVDDALTTLPNTAKGYAIDLSSEQNIKSFFDGIGSFDHLVYTAGENLSLIYLSNLELENARSFFNLRYWGALASLKYAAPHINQGGSVSLMSGTASARPGAGWLLGASICGAMDGLTRAMAVELAPIRVNAVSAGVIKTNLWNGLTEADREGMYKYLGDNLLLKRVGEAEDIALAFTYLMKQQHGTGQILAVEGGTLLV